MLSQWTQATSGWIVEHSKEFPKCMWRAPYIHVKAPAKSCSCMWRTHCQVKFLLHKRGPLCFVFQKWLASFLPCDTHSQALLKYPSSFLREFLCLLFTLAPIMSLPLLKSRHEISPPPMPQEILNNPHTLGMRSIQCIFQVCLFFAFLFVLCVVLLALHAFKKNF